MGYIWGTMEKHSWILNIFGIEMCEGVRYNDVVVHLKIEQK